MLKLCASIAVGRASALDTCSMGKGKTHGTNVWWREVHVSEFVLSALMMSGQEEAHDIVFERIQSKCICEQVTHPLY